MGNKWLYIPVNKFYNGNLGLVKQRYPLFCMDSAIDIMDN